VQVSIEDRDVEVPRQFALAQNFPNPFNATTIIQYSLPAASFVTIDIYDILGRKVETLMQREQPAGYHRITWDASDHSSGIYFYRIQAGEYAETRKMLLLK
jgi:flagellar hook assembly protein FlgD